MLPTGETGDVKLIDLTLHRYCQQPRSRSINKLDGRILWCNKSDFEAGVNKLKA